LLIVLDSTLLWLLVRTSSHAKVQQARSWVSARLSAGHQLAVAEITDYETRRELIRKNATAQILRLDALISQSEFLSIDRNTMLNAACIWANMRNSGYQTAADPALDADVILGAQALIRSRRFGGSSVVVATDNTRHLARICTAPLCTAMDWVTIT
jgi:predicted nucleic acid-binding protein